MNDLVVIYPIIRTDFIKRSLDTLFKYTPGVKVIIVDQTIDGFQDDRAIMTIRMKNQGFSKGANEGIIHALQWGTEYICVCNDDTEFMHDGWMEGIKETFASDPRILAVNPESPRVPMWGYGLNDGEMCEVIPYKEEFSAEDIAYLKAGDYDADEIQGRTPYKIPETFPMTKRGVVDGFAEWCPVFKHSFFDKVGFFDERFIWGGGEDYDMAGRAYSCAWPYPREECNENFHWRMVATMKSWVWHHWGRSKDVKEELDPKLFEGKEPWNDLSALWAPAPPTKQYPQGQHFDPWGHWTDDAGVKHPFKRDPKVHIEKM